MGYRIIESNEHPYRNRTTSTSAQKQALRMIRSPVQLSVSDEAVTFSRQPSSAPFVLFARNFQGLFCRQRYSPSVKTDPAHHLAEICGIHFQSTARAADSFVGFALSCPNSRATGGLGPTETRNIIGPVCHRASVASQQLRNCIRSQSTPQSAQQFTCTCTTVRHHIRATSGELPKASR
ncbi:hypothetical protein VTK73DRAFT_6653 [Phialemonium thermophilum]|uniref:Uncharacterized protein n=1 Tax=Phialemonium thermophilum TaxID=223376 RepID=A0ABR3WIZ3_9PEZI